MEGINQKVEDLLSKLTKRKSQRTKKCISKLCLTFGFISFVTADIQALKWFMVICLYSWENIFFSENCLCRSCTSLSQLIDKITQGAHTSVWPFACYNWQEMHGNIGAEKVNAKPFNLPKFKATEVTKKESSSFLFAFLILMETLLKIFSL